MNIDKKRTETLLESASKFTPFINIEDVTMITQSGSSKAVFRDYNNRAFSYTMKVAEIEDIDRKKISKCWLEDDFSFSKQVTGRILSMLEVLNLTPRFIALKRIYINNKIDLTKKYNVMCSLSPAEDKAGLNAFYFLREVEEEE